MSSSILAPDRMPDDHARRTSDGRMLAAVRHARKKVDQVKQMSISRPDLPTLWPVARPDRVLNREALFSFSGSPNALILAVRAFFGESPAEKVGFDGRRR